MEQHILQGNWKIDDTVDVAGRFSALTLACHLDHLEMVHLLDLLGANLSVGIGREKFTPLMVSTMRWNVRVVEYLLERGADPF